MAGETPHAKQWAAGYVLWDGSSLVSFETRKRLPGRDRLRKILSTLSSAENLISWPLPLRFDLLIRMALE